MFTVRFAAALVMGVALSAADSDHHLDVVILGNATSESQHHVVAQGRATDTTIATQLGALQRQYPARLLNDATASVQTQLLVGPGDTPILLEIEEIHDRRAQVFGYTVEVNGKPVFFRTYQEVGAGPNHFFVDVPRALAPDGVLAVTIRNQGDAPCAISHLWAYGDFARLTNEDDTWKPMPILGQARVMTGKVGTKGKHVALEGQIPTIPPDQDRAAWEELSAAFAACGATAPGFMDMGYYLAKNPAVQAREYETALRWAGTNKVAWQFHFMGGDWGGHPSIADGDGGDFYDIRYSQAVYDPTTGTYRPTWPHSPGGVIWPTAGDATLNQYIIARSRVTGRLLSDRVALCDAEGLRPTDLWLVGDEGPSYWWQNGFGDFSPALVAAAHRDGVELNPVSFTAAARRWLFNNLTARYAERSRAVIEGLGRDAVVVDRGTVRLPQEQLADTYYAHTFMNQSFPLFDPRWEGWQNGASDAGWIGGEPLEYVNPSFHDYITSQGRCTNVNLYRPILNPPYLQTLYQRGFRHVSLFDAYSGDMDMVTKALEDVDQHPSLPERHYLRRILDVDINLLERFTDAAGVTQVQNLRRAPRLEADIELIDASKPGVFTLRLGNGGQPLPEDLVLHLDFGRAGNPLAAEVQVAAGPDSQHVRPVTTLSTKQLDRTSYWPSFLTADIPLTGLTTGLKNAVVTVQLNAGKTGVSTGLRRFFVTRPWSFTSGSLVEATPTCREARTRRLWLQDRATAERLLAQHRQAGGAAATLAHAEHLLADGAPQRAYRTLSQAHSLLLPARIALRGHGPLGTYPITVNLSRDDATAMVELLRAGGPQGYDFTVTSEKALAAVVIFRGLDPAARYHATTEDGHVTVVPQADGAYAPNAAGTLTVPFRIPARPLPGDDGFLAKATGRVPSRHLVAVCREADLYEVQDPALIAWNPLRIVTAPGARLKRQQDGTSKVTSQGPQHYDRVEITLDDAGQAQAIEATYGVATGRIASFTPPAVHPAPCNGIITLDDGRRFELLYRMATGTQFVNLPALQRWARSNTIEAYISTLVPGLAVELAYAPAVVPDRLPRLLSVKATAATPPAARAK